MRRRSGAYGSTATEEWTDHSDVDLLAVMNIDPPVESLRFFVNGIAVDLNLRLCGDGAHGLAGADFVPDAVALWDPDDVFIEARPTERVHNAAGSDVVRYMLFHDSQKLRQIGDETLRRLAMGQVVERVLQAWYQARGEPFPGEVRSVYDLRRRDRAVVSLLDQALLASDVDVLMDAAEIAAAPIGGVFSPGDVLAVSWRRPSVEPIPELFRGLIEEVADQDGPSHP